MRSNCPVLNHCKRSESVGSNPVRRPARLLPAFLAVAGFFATPHAHAIDPATAAPAISQTIGEYGAPLDILRAFHSAPQHPLESNHYIQMWEGKKVSELVAWAGLTNTHTLFVNSHGKAMKGSTFSRPRHGYYAHDSLVTDPANPPCFSARDFATLLGEDAARIHNVLLAGCDMDRSFRVEEIRKYFVNATNIVHVPAGEAGYQPMYLQAFLTPSKEIKPLYESAQFNTMGVKEYHIKTLPSTRARKLSPYIANLYRPGAPLPYLVQRAGRELLEGTTRR